MPLLFNFQRGGHRGRGEIEKRKNRNRHGFDRLNGFENQDLNLIRSIRQIRGDFGIYWRTYSTQQPSDKVTAVRWSAGRSRPGQPVRGKSGLHRVRWWVTPTPGPPRCLPGARRYSGGTVQQKGNRPLCEFKVQKSKFKDQEAWVSIFEL